MGGRAGPAAVPAGDRRRAPHVRVLRGEQGGLPRCSTTRRRSSRVCRSTRRSSTFAGCGGSRARPPRSPRGCGATSASASACRSRSASRGRSSSPRWRAGSPSRTACSSVPPDGELAFLHPLPVERLWGVGPRDGSAAPRRGDHDGRPGRRGFARRRSSRCSAEPRAGTCTRSPTTATHGRCRCGAAGGSIGSQRALGRSPTSLAEVDAVARRPRRARHAPDASRRPGRPHGRASPALRRLLARDPLAHAAVRDREHRRRSSTTARVLLAAATPIIERAGITLVGIAVSNLDDGRASSSRCRSTGTAATTSTPRSTRCVVASARTAIVRAVLLGRSQGLAMPLLPD